MTEAADRLAVQVYLGPRSYEVFIVSGRLAALAAYLEPWVESRASGSRRTRTAFVVTDRNVAALYAAPVRDSLESAGWRCAVHEIEPGEPSKCLGVAAVLYDRMVEFGADRHTVVFAVGGGVVGDLAGFVAATFARGVPCVQIPTSLLAMVDSSVGGKVGVNHPRAKNMIGAFHQPLGVLIDTATIDTLPDREYRAGLAEVVKYGMILDAEFFEFLEANVAGVNQREPGVLRRIIARSCRLKADVVEQDEHERTGLRAALNYGHTFAHALETLTGYGELLHGEAVSIGMACAARLAERKRLIDRAIVERQSRLLERLGLPTALAPAHAAAVSTDAVLAAIRHDKKSVGGRATFILPRRIGQVERFSDIDAEDVRAALDWEPSGPGE
ncbi:MAG TPA: 3-dehydroquinate synthase [Planctomycetaceae bacterium]|nr:3-dehydroquinate synthase [Planctomycetaceae bacterium]